MYSDLQGLDTACLAGWVPGGTLAEARAVGLGPSFENEVVVATGLAAGDRLIVTGHQLVDAGDRVREVSEGGGR